MDVSHEDMAVSQIQNSFVKGWIEVLEAVLSNSNFICKNHDVDVALHTVFNALKKYPMDSSVEQVSGNIDVRDIGYDILANDILVNDDVEWTHHDVIKDAVSLVVNLRNNGICYSYCYLGTYLVLFEDDIIDDELEPLKIDYVQYSDNVHIEAKNDCWVLPACLRIYRDYMLQINH